MWLGMLSAAAGQVPGLPLAPLDALDALLLAYIAQVAAWCGGPSWAVVEVQLGPGGMARPTPRAGRSPCRDPPPRRRRLARARAPRPTRRARRRRLGATHPRSARGVRRGRRVALGCAGARRRSALLGGRTGAPPGRPGGPAGHGPRRRPGRRDPPPAPARAGGSGRRRPAGRWPRGEAPAAGVERLGAAVVTHDQSDHAGGIEELLGELPIGASSTAPARPRARRRGRAAGAARQRIAAGASCAPAACASTSLWPPPELLAAPPRRRRPEHAGAGPGRPLAPLLDAAHRRRRGGGGTARPRSGRRAQGRPPRQRRRRPRCAARAHPPRLAVISVGAGNSYGHPTRHAGDASLHTASGPCAPIRTAPSCSTSGETRLDRRRETEAPRRNASANIGVFLSFVLSPGADDETIIEKCCPRFDSGTWEVGQSLAGDEHAADGSAHASITLSRRGHRGRAWLDLAHLPAWLPAVFRDPIPAQRRSSAGSVAQCDPALTQSTAPRPVSPAPGSSRARLL